MKKNKFKNKKVEVDGILFDSKREADNWVYLCHLMDAGVITELDRQVEFELIPAQFEFDTVGVRGGKQKGKCIERKVKYIADFVYRDQLGQRVVEDVKGYTKNDPVYIIKRKLMLYIHGIRIKEVV
jgi:hypothetical protein